MTEEILAMAIQSEIQARNFYGRVSEKVTKPKVKRMVLKIAGDEAGHISVLSRQFRKRFGRDYAPGTTEADPKLKVADADAYSISAALEIVSVAIGLENKAIRFYSEQVERTDDQEERKLLAKLVRFEEGHKKKMQRQHGHLHKGGSWIGKD